MTIDLGGTPTPPPGFRSGFVGIVGRPNVGKSTLYNRLIGQRQAIIDDTSGVTRDRKYGVSDWNGKKFTVVDTGGFVQGSDDVFEAAIRSLLSVSNSKFVLLRLTTADCTEKGRFKRHYGHFSNISVSVDFVSGCGLCPQCRYFFRVFHLCDAGIGPTNPSFGYCGDAVY